MAAIAWFNNLPHNTAEHALRKFAERAGAVESIEMGRQGEMAWVTYKAPAGVEGALKLAGQDFYGRPLVVEASSRANDTRPEDKSKLVVLNIPRDTPTEEVRELMAVAVGGDERILRVSHRRDVAVFTLDSEDSAAAGLAMDGHVIGGVAVKVRYDRKGRTERAKARAAARKAERVTAGGAAEPSAEADGAAAAGEGKKRRKRRGKKAGAAAGGDAAPAAAPSASPAGERKGRTVLVSGLPAGTTEEAVRAHFAAGGAIARVSVLSEGAAARVTFEGPEGADAALVQDGATFAGAAITVTINRRRKSKGKRKGKKAAEGEAAPAEAGAGARRADAEEDEEEEEAEGAAPVRTPSEDEVCVRGLPAGATSDELRARFAGYGAIVSVKVKARGKEGGAVGWVRFEQAAAAKAALAEDGKVEDQTVEQALRVRRKGRGKRRAAAGAAAGGSA